MKWNLVRVISAGVHLGGNEQRGDWPLTSIQVAQIQVAASRVRVGDLYAFPVQRVLLGAHFFILF